MIIISIIDTYKNKGEKYAHHPIYNLLPILKNNYYFLQVANTMEWLVSASKNYVNGCRAISGNIK